MTQNSTNLLAGQTLTYSIRFNSPPLPRRHRVYVHFVNPVTNTFDFQDDIDPTPDVTQWTYGQVVTLNRSIQIPAGAPASRYLVSVGLYDPFTSTDPAKWTGWPVVAGTGVTRDAQGRNIIGAFNVIQVVQAESMSINAPEGEVSTAQKCVDGTGDVTLNGACLWGGADVTGVEGNWLSRGVGSFKVSVAGQYNIQVFASARQALNIWPIMELTIDGVFVGKLNVTGTDAANSYTYVTNLTVGTHTIMLNFPNDYYAPAATPPLDRNLFVDKAHIYLK